MSDNGVDYSSLNYEEHDDAHYSVTRQMAEDYMKNVDADGGSKIKMTEQDSGMVRLYEEGSNFRPIESDEIRGANVDPADLVVARSLKYDLNPDFFDQASDAGVDSHDQRIVELLRMGEMKADMEGVSRGGGAAELIKEAVSNGEIPAMSDDQIEKIVSQGYQLLDGYQQWKQDAGSDVQEYLSGEGPKVRKITDDAILEGLGGDSFTGDPLSTPYIVDDKFVVNSENVDEALKYSNGFEGNTKVFEVEPGTEMEGKTTIISNERVNAGDAIILVNGEPEFYQNAPPDFNLDDVEKSTLRTFKHVDGYTVDIYGQDESMQVHRILDDEQRVVFPTTWEEQTAGDQTVDRSDLMNLDKEDALTKADLIVAMHEREQGLEVGNGAADKKNDWDYDFE